MIPPPPETTPAAKVNRGYPQGWNVGHENDKKKNGNATTTNTANREKVSSASVNSEPVITSSYLRQYHKNRSTKDIVWGTLTTHLAKR
eukprot:scaffold27619_cov48-Attheya_sp.AAC.1